MIEKGQKINDRYEIIKTIGEGGMANVYLAYDTILDRRVAVKVLRGDLSNDEKFVRRFQREALSASSLSHPNIVEMYDVGEDNGIYYIIMEYIEGKTLKQLIKKRGALTLSEAIDIMLQITDGISEAHNSYIIHRDLKPQNIMIKEDGSIKITDFGIAMALNSTQLTQTNSVMGSVHYLPPEQASGKGSTIRSDIYSMGILFYELLTGTLPFKGDNAVEIALKQMRDKIPSVRKKNPAIPQSVENVIIKATAKNPKNRYSDSKEMHADLLTVLNDDRISEPKYEFKYPEHEVDENTAVLNKVKEKTEEKLEENKEVKEKIKEEVEEIVKPKTEEEELDELIFDKDDKQIKRTNKVIIILASIFSLIVIVLLCVFLIIPSFTKIPDVKIPDVKNLSVVDAETKLKKAGFEVNVETIKEGNTEMEKGNVIKTEPQIGRSIKKGSKITLYESLGNETYTVEDYTGSNYIEIQTLLKNMYELDVKIEKKDVDTSKEYDEQEIIDQSVKAGTALGKGDSITLYIPNVSEDVYPDMVSEGWRVDDVKKFCDKYELNCEIKEVETTDYEDGTIYYQSREPKKPILKTNYKYDLQIKVARAPKIEEPVQDLLPSTDEKDGNTTSSTDTKTDKTEKTQ